MRMFNRVHPSVLICLASLAYSFTWWALSDSQALSPVGFTQVEFQAEGVEAYRYNLNDADHGCLVLVAVEGMGSPKPTVGCW